MIPRVNSTRKHATRKPRASGDDPEAAEELRARAG